MVKQLSATHRSSGLGGGGSTRSRVAMAKFSVLLLLSIFSYFTQQYDVQVSALYSPNSTVQVLTSDQLKKTVVDSEDLFIVEFFAPWCRRSKSFVPEYEKAANAMKGFVRFVAVEDQVAVQQYNVSTFPTVKAFIGQKGKTPKIVDFNKNLTVAELVLFAQNQIEEIVQARIGGQSAKRTSGGSSGSDVIELTHENFERLVTSDEKNAWFIMFYAEWCGHCKAMKNDWNELATRTKDKVKIGKVNASEDRILAARFQISGFPTLKVFPAGKKSDSLAQAYEGPRHLKDLTSHIMSYYSANLETEQLLNEEQFEKCSKGVCMIAFLPHIRDSGAKGRNTYLKDLNEIAKASVAMPISFYWSQGGDQFEFEEKLHMAFGYPALVAVNKEKGRYSIHRGNFGKESINSFVTGLMAGESPVDPLPENLPKLKSVEKWDGKDAPPPTPDDTLDDEL